MSSASTGIPLCYRGKTSPPDTNGCTNEEALNAAESAMLGERREHAAVEYG
jgi:hypothetical protein